MTTLVTSRKVRSVPAAFRADIEGLRAIAVLLVVLFHASVPGFDGGFVGVDVFFVISGYLITGLLLREIETTGHLRLGTFYARRAKRLLPPAAVVVGVTAIAMWFVMPLLAVFKTAFDLLAATFYFSNWRLISQGNDYLGGANHDNVTLHFWSLAVEEQFYLVWPALLIATLAVANAFHRNLRSTFAVVATVATVGSFTASWLLTTADPALAYMATYTCAWQFGAGALLAVAAPWLLRRNCWPKWIGWLGLAAIGVSATTFDATTPYPGLAALLPTLGAVAAIGPSSVSFSYRALTGPVLRAMGRWSYPWYLWHWPVVVFAELKFGPLPWPTKVALMGLALALAAITHHLVERPVQSSRVLQRRVPACAAVGLAATVLATAIVMTVGTKAVEALGSGTDAPNALSFQEVFGSQSGTNSGPVSPSPINARGDIPTDPDCLIDRTSEQPECMFGVPGGTPVVLFGDSHAHQWQTALENIAAERNWSLRVVAQSGCPVPKIKPRSGEKARFSQSYCSDWRDEQLDKIVDYRPALVIVSSLNFYIPQADELFEAWRESLTRLRESGARVVYVRDTPYPQSDVPECVSSALDDWARCEFELSDRVDPVVAGKLRNQLGDVEIIDLNGYLCDGTICPAVRNGTLLYRDDSHLTDTAVELLTPAFAAALDENGIR